MAPGESAPPAAIVVPTVKKRLSPEGLAYLKRIRENYERIQFGTEGKARLMELAIEREAKKRLEEAEFEAAVQAKMAAMRVTTQ